MLRSWVLLLLLMPALAEASPIVITSATRSLSRSVDEINTPGEPPSNGGVPLDTASTTALGDFSADLSTTYVAGDGVFLDIAAVHQSTVADGAITFSTSALVTAVDPPGGASANDLSASAISFVDVTFDVQSPVHVTIDWNDRASCNDSECTVMLLEVLGTSTVVFDIAGAQNPGGEPVGIFEADLTVGSYRFRAGTFGNWFVRERSFPGGGLDAALTFVPEPATAILIAVGFAFAAARARRS